VHIDSPKIDEYLVDMLALEKHSEGFKGDVVFCCVGTTASKTPDKNKYARVDYGIPVTAAKLSKANNIPRFIVMSSMGADPSSSVFYNIIKGEMERDVLLCEIENTYILRPSLIGGRRAEVRKGERFAQFMMGSFDLIVPNKYKMIHPERIANTMLWLSKNTFSKRILPSELISKIGLR
jgi:uncharacterized protein YbjT (DUF2867 family)